MHLAPELTSATLALGAGLHLLLEPLGVLGYEVSHLPEPPEPNSSDG